MAAPLRSLTLHMRTARRLLRRRPPLRSLAEPVDGRLVFVFGSPRSGTTFLAGAIGSCPGFVDLGEVAAFKAAIPELAALDPQLAARRIRRLLMVTCRLSLVGRSRAVEQTPEAAYVAKAIRLAFPSSTLVHIVRDGRDVACSLLERGWLSAGRSGADDAGLAYGPEARFWVEPERRDEFALASDARRAAWAWRRYVTVARAATPYEVRYEQLAADPLGAGAELADALGAERDALAAALSAVHAASVGRYRRDLEASQLADIEDEAGELLRELGYLR